MSTAKPAEPGQHERYYRAVVDAAAANNTMLDLLYGSNPITDDELRQLIAKRPEVYGRFAGYLGKRKL